MQISALDVAGNEHALRVFCNASHDAFRRGPGSYLYLADLPCLVQKCVQESLEGQFDDLRTYTADDENQYTVLCLAGAADPFGGNLDPYNPALLPFPAAWNPRHVTLNPQVAEFLTGVYKFPTNASSFAYIHGPGHSFAVDPEADVEVYNCHGEFRGYNYGA